MCDFKEKGKSHLNNGKNIERQIEEAQKLVARQVDNISFKILHSTSHKSEDLHIAITYESEKRSK